MGREWLPDDVSARVVRLKVSRATEEAMPRRNKDALELARNPQLTRGHLCKRALLRTVAERRPFRPRSRQPLPESQDAAGSAKVSSSDELQCWRTERSTRGIAVGGKDEKRGICDRAQSGGAASASAQLDR